MSCWGLWWGPPAPTFWDHWFGAVRLEWRSGWLRSDALDGRHGNSSPDECSHKGSSDPDHPTPGGAGPSDDGRCPHGRLSVGTDTQRQVPLIRCCSRRIQMLTVTGCPDPTALSHGCPHGRLSTWMVAQRQGLQTEVHSRHLWIRRPDTGCPRSAVPSVDRWVSPWPAFDTGWRSASGAPDWPRLLWHLDDVFLKTRLGT